mmetsp:Transcript_1028/g.1628  ORF Transcript_1028/g.1628 Transcript_1028/m.1628 type:complete len:260 (+) Transcript_1028:3094-3873(+)
MASFFCLISYSAASSLAVVSVFASFSSDSCSSSIPTRAVRWPCFRSLASFSACRRESRLLLLVCSSVSLFTWSRRTATSFSDSTSLTPFFAASCSRSSNWFRSFIVDSSFVLTSESFVLSLFDFSMPASLSTVSSSIFFWNFVFSCSNCSCCWSREAAVSELFETVFCNSFVSESSLVLSSSCDFISESRVLCSEAFSSVKDDDAMIAAFNCLTNLLKVSSLPDISLCNRSTATECFSSTPCTFSSNIFLSSPHRFSPF